MFTNNFKRLINNQLKENKLVNEQNKQELMKEGNSEKILKLAS